MTDEDQAKLVKELADVAEAHYQPMIDVLARTLRALVDQVNDYERVNNLAPNPGRTECWDTVARAKEVLRVVESPKP